MHASSVWKIHAAGVGAAAMLTGAGYFFGLNPMLTAYAQQAAQRERMDAMERQLKDVVQERVLLAEQVADAEERARNEVIVLESRRQLNARMAAITELATEADLNVHAIQPREIRSGEAYDVVPIELTGRGGYPDAVAFTDALHAAFADLSMEAFTLSGNPRSEREGDSFSFSLAWYTESRRSSD